MGIDSQAAPRLISQNRFSVQSGRQGRSELGLGLGKGLEELRRLRPVRAFMCYLITQVPHTKTTREI